MKKRFDAKKTMKRIMLLLTVMIMAMMVLEIAVADHSPAMGQASGDVPNEGSGQGSGAGKKSNAKQPKLTFDSEIPYFNEEYLRWLINEFLTNYNYSNWQEERIDGFFATSEFTGNFNNLVLNHEHGFELWIYVDETIGDPKSRIDSVFIEYYHFDDNMNQFRFGFVQTIGKRVVNVLYDSREEMSVQGVTISEEDLGKGVLELLALLKETNSDGDGWTEEELKSREEALISFYDAFSDEMGKKNPDFFITKVLEDMTITPDNVAGYGEFGGNAYIVYPRKGSFVLWYGAPGQDDCTEKKIGKYDSVVRFQDSLCFTSGKELLLLDLSRLEEKKLPKPYKLQKGTSVINGGNYLGWLGAKGELYYTSDGAAIVTADLPQGTTFEFRDGIIAATYDNPKKPDEEALFWTIGPKDGVLSVDQARYDEIYAMQPVTLLQ